MATPATNGVGFISGSPVFASVRGQEGLGMLRKPQKDRSALRGYYHGRNGMGTTV